MKNNIGSLQQIYDKVQNLNRKNNLLKAKYENDAKYARYAQTHCGAGQYF
jgi:type I restriction enzyme R subunit